jgi:uncharacterized protein YodC (DUF2158 family)
MAKKLDKSSSDSVMIAPFQLGSTRQLFCSAGFLLRGMVWRNAITKEMIMTKNPLAVGDTVKPKSLFGQTMEIIAISDDGEITCRYGERENEQFKTFDADALVRCRPMPKLAIIYASRADLGLH